MCKNIDDSVNPMPTGDCKGEAVALKSLIGIMAALNCIISVPSFTKNIEDTKKNKRSIAIYDGLNLIVTLFDFAMSCGVGYGIYSPMDSSNKNIIGSDYEKAITATSDAAAKYSTIWIVKTAIALFIPSISVIKTIADNPKKVKKKDAKVEATRGEASEGDAFKKEDSNFLKNIEMVNSACSGILCMISAFFEMIACIEAGKVDGDKLNKNEKRDKSCFLCETVGFICDDVCAVFDSITSIVNSNNIPAFIIRESFEAAYAISMFTEAGIIDNE